MSFFKQDPEIQRRRYEAKIRELTKKKATLQEVVIEKDKINKLRSEVKSLKSEASPIHLNQEKVQKFKSFLGKIAKGARSMSPPQSQSQFTTPSNGRQKQQFNSQPIFGFGGDNFDPNAGMMGSGRQRKKKKMYGGLL